MYINSCKKKVGVHGKCINGSHYFIHVRAQRRDLDIDKPPDGENWILSECVGIGVTWLDQDSKKRKVATIEETYSNDVAPSVALPDKRMYSGQLLSNSGCALVEYGGRIDDDDGKDEVRGQ